MWIRYQRHHLRQNKQTEFRTKYAKNTDIQICYYMINNTLSWLKCEILNKPRFPSYPDADDLGWDWGIFKTTYKTVLNSMACTRNGVDGTLYTKPRYNAETGRHTRFEIDCFYAPRIQYLFFYDISFCHLYLYFTYVGVQIFWINPHDEPDDDLSYPFPRGL